jgi:hypothetical protein
MELHGELLPTVGSSRDPEPFVIAHEIRLSAGWDCLEVFPGIVIEKWKPELAQFWAESDLLGAILVAQTKDARFKDLDPRAATRRQYSALLARFREALDSATNEQDLQTFLEENPVLLCPTFTKVYPKLRFGTHISDFVFSQADREYLLVEIEPATHKLFRLDGHPTAELTHAQGQIADWKRYIEDNLSTVQRELKLEGITSQARGLVVIGRSRDLSEGDRRKIQVMHNESPRIRIATYDDIHDIAKAMFENLLGPMSDFGGATRVYFPSHSA